MAALVPIAICFAIVFRWLSDLTPEQPKPPVDDDTDDDAEPWEDPDVIEVERFAACYGVQPVRVRA
jgi:hypothetical protein